MSRVNTTLPIIGLWPVTGSFFISQNWNLCVHQFKFFTHNLRLFGECFVYSRKFTSQKVYMNLSPML